MRLPSSSLKLSAITALVVLTSWTPVAQQTNGDRLLGPVFKSIGPLAFGPNGVLFAADTEASTIFALELGTRANIVAGTKDFPAIDQKIAGLLGTDVREISITDMAVDPQSQNSFISVMRGQGVQSIPVLVRVDGAGAIEVLKFDALKYSKVMLPSAPQPTPEPTPAPGWARGRARVESITDMAYVEGRVYVAGLSSEEFASKLRSLAYPFSTVDAGTSVEIFHGNHGRLETRSPVYAFLPYRVDNTPHLIAAYLCTPLVKFPLSSLTPGAKVLGTTIAELGGGNRPLDMILYRKGGHEFLLVSNTSMATLKIPTDQFGTAKPITAPVRGTAGIPGEKIAGMTGIEQLDRLDEQRVAVLARAEGGALNLETPQLP